MSDLVCSVQNLSVSYGRRLIVDQVSFEIRSGEGLALLGMNGAGKSTIVRSVMGLMRPKTGRVTLLGSLSPRDALGRVGYCPEDASAPELLSVQEYLRFVESFKMFDRHGIQQAVPQVTHEFDLMGHQRITELSKGGGRRLVLAQAFMGMPKFLVLDEPLNGLDPVMIANLRKLITDYRAKGGALLYCSHLLAESERCCSHVAILHRGKGLEYGPIDEVRARFGSLERAFRAVGTQGDR